jgi:hypothetical protein
MRKLLSTLFLISVCTITRSQNLAFSQVQTFTGELPPTVNTPGPVYTVPAGKVWKIESLNSTVNQSLGFKLNNTFFHVTPVSYSSQIVFPIWLKEGDTVQPFVVTNFPSVMYGYFISIIEFSAN